MSDYLRFTIGYMDGDGTARLDATVQCKGFCGNSSGWFGITQLDEFADLLLAYPLPDDGHPPLRAGFWSKTTRGEIDQLHISLRVYPEFCRIDLQRGRFLFLHNLGRGRKYSRFSRRRAAGGQTPSLNPPVLTTTKQPFARDPPSYGERLAAASEAKTPA
jgi:hypothetical protein